MKNTAIIASMAAAAALVSAGEVDTGGITINPDGSYTCAKANAAYCAGDSLKTDIIIRCYGTRGVAGRCSDNLAGEPPIGVSTALCYQTDGHEGDAACEKNCVVYGGSGNGKGTFTLPAAICTPTYTATSSSATSTSKPTSSSSSKPASTSTSSPSYPTTSVKTSTATEYPPHTSKTWTQTYKPPHWSSKEDCTTGEETKTKTISYPTWVPTTAYSQSSVHSSVIYPTNNGTTIVKSTTPVVPTAPTPTKVPTNTPVPAGAVHNSAAGGALAVVAFVAAYIL